MRTHHRETESVVHNVDRMEFMRSQRYHAFDLAICDPPYFSEPERRGYYGRRESKTGVKRVYRCSAEWQLPQLEYFTELRRVARHYIDRGKVFLPSGKVATQLTLF